MKNWRPHTWSITRGLVTIAVLPAALMLLLASATNFISRERDIRADVKERGQLIASAIAESSQYGIVSGNADDLRRAASRFTTAEKSIATIRIFDAENRLVAEARNRFQSKDELMRFIEPIRVAEVQANPDGFVTDRGESRQRGERATSVQGMVEVHMSATPILDSKMRGLWASLLTVGAYGFACAGIGLFLARRFMAPLTAVMGALRQMRRGHFDVVLDRTSPGELGELQAATLEVARTLGTSQRELERQVAARTSDLEQAVALANEAHADRLALIGRWNAALEDERKRIAVEIHDHLNAALIAVKMRAEHISALAIDSPTPDEVAEIRQTAQATARTVETLYAAARRIIKQLRPEVIDTLGLKGALAGMIREYDELHAGCQFALSVEPGFPDVRGNDAMTAYRLVQEALSNVVKHAGARTANVAIAFHGATKSLHVAVEDDGKGFDASTRPTGSIGLIGMRERVSACGGSMTISTSVGSGTKVVFVLPIGAQT